VLSRVLGQRARARVRQALTTLKERPSIRTSVARGRVGRLVSRGRTHEEIHPPASPLTGPSGGLLSERRVDHFPSGAPSLESDRTVSHSYHRPLTTGHSISARHRSTPRYCDVRRPFFTSLSPREVLTERVGTRNGTSPDTRTRLVRERDTSFSQTVTVIDFRVGGEGGIRIYSQIRSLRTARNTELLSR